MGLMESPQDSVVSKATASIHANVDDIQSSATNAANISRETEHDTIATTRQDLIIDLTTITDHKVTRLKTQLEEITLSATQDFTTKATATVTHFLMEVEALTKVMEYLESRQKILQNTLKKDASLITYKGMEQKPSPERIISMLFHSSLP